ncbi:MAG: MTH1187 family thiamine-binding protein [Phycisphaerae bacterium]
MSVLVEFSMTPLDKGPSVSRYVSRSIDIVDKSGLPYRLNAMGTILEGQWQECMDIVTRCYERMSADCERITCSIKVDYRRDHSGRLEAKAKRVEEILGRPLKRE